MINHLQSSVLPGKVLFLQHEVPKQEHRVLAIIYAHYSFRIATLFIEIMTVSCGAACTQIKRPSSGSHRARQHQREHAELQSFFFFLCLLLYLLSCHRSICSIITSLAMEMRPAEKKQVLQKLALEKMNEPTLARMKNRQNRVVVLPEAGPGSRCPTELAFPQPSSRALTLKRNRGV